MHIGQSIGPFTLEKELGSGAMGTVYRALFKEAGKPDKRVALKVIAFGLTGNEQALARFEREYNILKQLKHPNIVRQFAWGKFKGTPFFAMEFVDGRSLDKVLADRIVAAPTRPPFSWDEVVEMGKPLCSALQHAHDKGIIHRDLKPSNLMVTTEGVLKLTDFGIAKDIDVTALTGANNTIGTAAYMSPEQCKGERLLTGKSDVYSLGVVFYELLTGRKPFQAESSVDMFLLHVQGTFPRPAVLNPDIPVWLDTLVCQMMEKKPEHRPRDAAMVGQVLEEIEQKVAANVSAGADIAGSRHLDPRYLGDDDKKAARAIRAGAKKKKLRKRRRAIYNRGWFVLLACIALVGGLSTIVYFGAIAAPSADSLLQKIEAAKDPDKQKELVAEYLKHYSGRADEATRKVQSLDRDFKVAERERVLLNRFGMQNMRGSPAEGDDPEAYRQTMSALQAENAGDLPLAKTSWTALADKYANEKDESKALWGWVAQKKLATLKAKDDWLIEVAGRINRDFRAEDKDVRFGDDLADRVANLLRLEQFGDFYLAHERWDLLAKSLEGDKARRADFVMARGKAHGLDGRKDQPKDTAARIKLINDKLAAAKELLTNELPARKQDGRNILRDIRDLYAGETGDLGKLVDDANRLLTRPS